MKRLIRNNIKASSNITSSNYVFTPTEVVDLLSQIEELKDCLVTVNEIANGLVFTIGNVTYDVAMS